MTDFKVPPGSDLAIDLRRKRQRKAPTSLPAPGDDGHGLIAAEGDSTRYVFRGVGLTFFDLGVRRAEGGGWVYAPASLVFDTPSEDASENGANGVAAWNAAFLADLDPWPTFLRLSEHVENLYTDLSFTHEGEEEKRYIVGKGGERGYLTDYHPGGAGAPRENPEWRQSSLRPKLEGGEWAARLESVWHYNAFDTSSTSSNYKVTREPDPAAEGAPLTFKRGDQAEFYLTPKMGPWVGFDSGFCRLARMPMLPAPDTYVAQFPEVYEEAEAAIGGKPPSPVWDRHFALLRDAGLAEEVWPSDISWTFLNDTGLMLGNVLGAGSPLVAIVRRGGSLYYVWGVMGDPESYPAYLQALLYNPVL